MWDVCYKTRILVCQFQHKVRPRPITLCWENHAKATCSLPPFPHPRPYHPNVAPGKAATFQGFPHYICEHRVQSPPSNQIGRLGSYGPDGRIYVRENPWWVTCPGNQCHSEHPRALCFSYKELLGSPQAACDETQWRKRCRWATSEFDGSRCGHDLRSEGGWWSQYSRCGAVDDEHLHYDGLLPVWRACKEGLHSIHRYSTWPLFECGGRIWVVFSLQLFDCIFIYFFIFSFGLGGGGWLESAWQIFKEKKRSYPRCRETTIFSTLNNWCFLH